MAKINPEEADLCCDSCEVHENLVKIVNETMPDETELRQLAESAIAKLETMTDAAFDALAEDSLPFLADE